MESLQLLENLINRVNDIYQKTLNNEPVWNDYQNLRNDPQFRDPEPGKYWSKLFVLLRKSFDTGKDTQSNDAELVPLASASLPCIRRYCGKINLKYNFAIVDYMATDMSDHSLDSIKIVFDDMCYFIEEYDDFIRVAPTKECEWADTVLRIYEQECLNKKINRKPSVTESLKILVNLIRRIDIIRYLGLTENMSKRDYDRRMNRLRYDSEFNSNDHRGRYWDKVFKKIKTVIVNSAPVLEQGESVECVDDKSPTTNVLDSSYRRNSRTYTCRLKFHSYIGDAMVIFTTYETSNTKDIDIDNLDIICGNHKYSIRTNSDTISVYKIK